MRLAILPPLLALALAACATGPEEKTVRGRLECEDGRRLEVTFNHTRDLAAVKLSKKQTVELPSLHPQSGMRFSGDGYELRGAGDRLTFTAPGAASVSCLQVR